MSITNLSSNNLSISVVVPIRNVENMIEVVLHQILEGLQGNQVKLIILDNSSTDRTKQRVLKIIESFQNEPKYTFQFVLNKENFGYGGSLKKGLQIAKKSDPDWIMVAHGDDQTDWNTTTRAMTQAAKNCENDLIIASRFMEKSHVMNYSSERKYANYAFRLITNKLFKTKMSDPGAAILMIRKESLKLEWVIHLKEDYLFHPGLNIVFHKSNLKITEIPMNWKDASHPGEIKLIKYGVALFVFLIKVYLRKKILKLDWVKSVAR